MTAGTHLRFAGQLNSASFVAFADHRAARLGLDLAIVSAGAGAVDVAVVGPEVLVDAFEMACSLGPIDCLIVDVARLTPPPGAPEDRAP